MPLPTTHLGSNKAVVTIDRDLCTECGACARVCFGKPLEFENGAITIDPTRIFGCIACGACMAVCPTGAVTVVGRDLSPDDVVDLPGPDARASYEQLLALLSHRRSVRCFTAREVEPEIVERLLEAASTAPMGVPPSEVGVLVLEGREKVSAYAAEATAWISSAARWMRPVLPLMRPFMRREDHLMFRDFVIPAARIYAEKAEEGTDWLMYDAPLAMIFYGTGINDPADPYIPATLAVVAAESLGLGSCMLGFAGYPLFYSKKARWRHGLPDRVRPGVAVIFGYASVQPAHGIARRFSRVTRER